MRLKARRKIILWRRGIRERRIFDDRWSCPRATNGEEIRWYRDKITKITHSDHMSLRLQVFALIRPAIISKLFPSGCKSMYSDGEPGSGVVLKKP